MGTEHSTKDYNKHSGFPVQRLLYLGPGAQRLGQLRVSLPRPPSGTRSQDGISKLVFCVKMGLVFRLEVQVGAAVLVENPPGRVAHDGVLGFVHFGEDVV